MSRLTAAAVLLLAANVHAQVDRPAPAGDKPTLKLPAQVQAQPGQPFRVVAETNLRWVRWTIPSGLTRIPPDWTTDGDKAFVGYGPAGAYEFKVEGTLNDQYTDAKCIVFVGQPVPPGPTPPGPGPTPPNPTDPLATDLAKAYGLEPSTDKAAQKAKLAEVYHYAGKAAQTDATLSTVAQLNEKVSLVGNAFVGKDALPGVRARIREENAKALPAGPATPLGDAATEATSGQPAKPASEIRLAISLHYERLAKALESIK